MPAYYIVPDDFAQTGRRSMEAVLECVVSNSSEKTEDGMFGGPSAAGCSW